MLQNDCDAFLVNGSLEMEQPENRLYLFVAKYTTLLACVKNVFSSIFINLETGKAENLTDLVAHFEADIEALKDDILKITQDPDTNEAIIFQSSICRSSLMKYRTLAESFYAMLDALNEDDHEINGTEIISSVEHFASSFRSYLVPNTKLDMMESCFHFQRFFWWRHIRTSQCVPSTHIQYSPQKYSSETGHLGLPTFEPSELESLEYVRFLIEITQLETRCPDNYWEDFVPQSQSLTTVDPYFVEATLCVFQFVGAKGPPVSAFGFTFSPPPSGEWLSVVPQTYICGLTQRNQAGHQEKAFQITLCLDDLVSRSSCCNLNLRSKT